MRGCDHAVWECSACREARARERAASVRGPYVEVGGVRFDLSRSEQMDAARSALCAAGEASGRIYGSDGTPTRRLLRAARYVEIVREGLEDPRR